MAKKGNCPSSKVGVKGFFRVQLKDKKTGKIEGDSGWCENTVTNTGLNTIAGCCIAEAGSYQIGYVVLATQSTAVDATQTVLVGTENQFEAVGAASTVATGTARVTVSFDGANNSDTITIGTIGLHKTNTAGSLFAGQTYTTSDFTTDQDVNATYELRFS